MRTVSCCFSVFLMAASPATLVIYSVKVIVFRCLGANFPTPNSDHCRENQYILLNAETEKRLQRV